MNSIRSLLILLIIAVTGCSKKTATVENKDEFSGKGYTAATIYMPEGMAGCPFLIKTTNFTLEPLNLQEEFKQDSMQVWVKYHKEKGMMSVCMMGDIITIDDIQHRK
ncbi:MAG: hypothetical protein ABI772_12165 [Bacteroidota bacterium]